ncbi:MAG: adenosine deaminase [Candidatus Acidiferrales bacterium]|jgi:adenosine deaminase
MLGVRMRGCGKHTLSFALLLLFWIGASGQTETAVWSRQSNGEQSASRAMEFARANPLALRAFLVAMPKGGDLHNHLSGAVYAESWIRAAVEDRLCIDRAKLSFARPPAHAAAPVSCGEGKVPASDAYKDQQLYDALIDAFSMRGFVPSTGVTGHDHFFDTFGRFGGADPPQVGAFPQHTGEWVDEVATRAAAQNEQYLELMYTPNFSHTASMATEIGWKYDFAQLRQDLLDHGLRDDVAVASRSLDQAEALRLERERCGEKDESPACRVKIRYLYQVLRGFPKEQVFAQTLLGFETASADPRFVGINFVMPEDGRVSLDDYTLHMRVVGFLHNLYPKVHISLHAGELVAGLVAPEGLCCHIHQAVEYAHAERIGHGVDVMFEDHPYDLLKEMAALHVMVEINLTSNDVILGVTGKDHPFPVYRKWSVPVALSTDDEGVSRIDLTHEYVRAVQTYDLHYADLKKMVRTSLEHSFLPGPSLWVARDVFARIVPDCSAGRLGEQKLSASCEAFLQSSEKASQQWELERRLRVFEASH